MVFYVLSWFFVLGLLALWSLAAWGFHAVAAWALAQAGAWGEGGGGGSVGAVLELPAWLAPWLPPEVATALQALLAAGVPFVQGLLQAVPSLGGLLSLATWLLWGLGAVLLVLLGLGLHLLIALARRGSGGGHAGPSPAAA